MGRKEILNEDDVRALIKDLRDEIEEEMEANGNEGFYLDFSDNKEYCGLNSGFKVIGKSSRDPDIFVCYVKKNSPTVGEIDQFNFLIESCDF